ncbi:MAG: Maf family protein [Promethearchaeota archaeon]
MQKKIILASQSRDRHEILKRAKIPFEIKVANIDEDKFKKNINVPTKLITELAKAKALYVKKLILKEGLNAIIIAADTIVECDGQIIGKAANEENAFQILKSLQNRQHNLLTGIAIVDTLSPKVIVDFEQTIVHFGKLSDEEILSYIKIGEWKGRAGAYSINNKANIFIKSINGSFSNVIGLPLFKIYTILKEHFNFNLLNKH